MVNIWYNHYDYSVTESHNLEMVLTQTINITQAWSLRIQKSAHSNAGWVLLTFNCPGVSLDSIVVFRQLFWSDLLQKIKHWINMDYYTEAEYVTAKPVHTWNFQQHTSITLCPQLPQSCDEPLQNCSLRLVLGDMKYQSQAVVTWIL